MSCTKPFERKLVSSHGDLLWNLPQWAVDTFDVLTSLLAMRLEWSRLVLGIRNLILNSGLTEPLFSSGSQIDAETWQRGGRLMALEIHTDSLMSPTTTESKCSLAWNVHAPNVFFLSQLHDRLFRRHLDYCTPEWTFILYSPIQKYWLNQIASG